jgi:hypothetical protein
VITGVYPDVRASLLARGWVENPDPDSSFFDLKWCLRTRSIYNPPLLRHQIVNHYSGAGACLTTKYGLLESIQHIRWYFDINVGTFFPRAMKLGTPAEFQALETEFKWCAAASILRRLLLDNGLSHEGVPSAEHVQLAIRVCRQQTAFRKDLIDDDAADGSLPCLPLMPEDKWAILLACPCCALPTMPYMGGTGMLFPNPCCLCAHQASWFRLDCSSQYISGIQGRQNLLPAQLCTHSCMLTMHAAIELLIMLQT